VSTMLENIIDAEVQSTLPPFVRAFMAHGHVVCHCNRSAQLVGSGSWRQWTCETGACDYAVKADELQPRRTETAEKHETGQKTAITRQETPLQKQSVPPLLTDDELLQELAEHCAFKTDAVPEPIALGFALFLQNVAPIGAWTKELAKEHWPRFQAARQAA